MSRHVVEVEVSLHSFLDRKMVSHTQQLLYTWTDSLVPTELEARWAPELVSMFQKNLLLLLGFELWIVQPVAPPPHYNDFASLAPHAC